MAETVGNNSRRATRGRRGSIYAVVMSMAVLVSLIGLSAVAVGRINLRTASGSGEATSAEQLAVSAVEHAVSVLNSEPGWRNNSAYWQESPTTPTRLGPGSFSWLLRDELDGDVRLSMGGIQPVRVFGVGQVGEARRKYSVLVVPTGPNLLSNPGMESGVLPYEPAAANCVLEVSAIAPRNGVRSLWVKSRVDRLAGPRQNVLGKISTDKSYYVEAWMKMSTAPEIPKICLVVSSNGSEQIYRAGPVNPVGLDWTRVGVALNTNYGGTVDKAYWRIETSSTAQEFWVDDVKLIESTSATAMPMSPVRDTWRQEPAQ